MEILFILSIPIFIADILAINLLVDAVRAKGWYLQKGAGELWFIGLLATPITLGLYTASLPDRSAQQPAIADPTDDLPAL